MAAPLRIVASSCPKAAQVRSPQWSENARSDPRRVRGQEPSAVRERERIVVAVLADAETR
jgi:hypothetical protein